MAIFAIFPTLPRFRAGVVMDFIIMFLIGVDLTIISGWALPPRF